jgi:hypothetical protein
MRSIGLRALIRMGVLTGLLLNPIPTNAQYYCSNVPDSSSQCLSDWCRICDPKEWMGENEGLDQLTKCPEFNQSSFSNSCPYKSPDRERSFSEEEDLEGEIQAQGQNELPKSAEEVCGGEASCELKYWEDNCGKGGWSVSNNQPPNC